MGCATWTTGRIYNERCDQCEHALYWHNIIYDPVTGGAPMPEDGWPCLACDWEARLKALENQ